MPYEEITELMHEIQADADAKHAKARVNAHIQEQIDAGEWKFSEYKTPRTYRREVYRVCPDGTSWEYQGTFDSFGIVTADPMVERVAKVLAALDARILSL